MIQKDKKTEIITVYKQGEKYFEEEKCVTLIEKTDKNTLFDCTEGTIVIANCIVVPKEIQIKIKPMELGWKKLKNDIKNFQVLSEKFSDELIAFCFKVDKPLLSLYLNGEELKTYRLEEGQKEFLLEFNGKKINIQVPNVMEMQARYAFIRFED